MPKLLTIRKQAWVDKRRPDLIRGKPLNHPAAVESRYARGLEDLVDRMSREVEKKLLAFFETDHAQEYFAADESVSAQARILMNALMQRFNDLFASNAKPAAESMADQTDRASSAGVHSSIQQLSGGLSLKTAALTGDLKDILSATISENVQLIKSISQEYLSGVQGAVMRSITTGNGKADLVPYLAKHKEITLRRARFIAADQTRKAYSNLNKGRMENVGITRGEWLHTAGSAHPRKSHIEMSGKAFDLKTGLYDPAVDRYVFPAEEPGCRCRMVPVIEFAD